MILAVDARNNSIAIGVKAEDRWLCRFTLASQVRSSDEWHFLISRMISDRGLPTLVFERVILSSVVPSLTPRLVACLRHFLADGDEVLVVGPGLRTGIRIRTENPAEVGSDLVCNAVAALEFMAPPLLIVDFGTALSVTAIDAAGDLVGVALAPGMELAVDALRTGGARIPQVRLEDPRRACGRNTNESVSSGLVYGYRGLVRELCSMMSAAMGGEARVVGTAKTEGPPLDMGPDFWVWRPRLSLEGLALIATRQR